MIKNLPIRMTDKNIKKRDSSQTFRDGGGRKVKTYTKLTWLY